MYRMNWKPCTYITNNPLCPSAGVGSPRKRGLRPYVIRTHVLNVFFKIWVVYANRTWMSEPCQNLDKLSRKNINKNVASGWFLSFIVLWYKLYNILNLKSERFVMYFFLNRWIWILCELRSVIFNWIMILKYGSSAERYSFNTRNTY